LLCVALPESAHGFSAEVYFVPGNTGWPAPVNTRWHRVANPIAATSHRTPAITGKDFLTGRATTIAEFSYCAGVNDKPTPVQVYRAASGKLVEFTELR